MVVFTPCHANYSQKLLKAALIPIAEKTVLKLRLIQPHNVHV